MSSNEVSNDMESQIVLQMDEEKSSISVSDVNENISTLCDTSDMSFDKLTDGLTLKPEHWTDEYWQTITTDFKWFLHKDGYAGCVICFNNKMFVGKRSMLATKKMKLMDFGYEQFENKLNDHKLSVQHIKSMASYMKSCPQLNAPATNTIKGITASVVKPDQPFDFPCHSCNKGYKLKKALAKHIYSCNNKSTSTGFQSPCNCQGVLLYSICSIDDHNKQCHSNRLMFNCTMCKEQFKSATILFGHLLLSHDHQWNPFTDMPTVVETPIKEEETLNLGSRADRKKSHIKSDSIWYRYDVAGDKRVATDIDSELAVKRRKVDKEERIVSTKIEKVVATNTNERSTLPHSFDQIQTCQYCGGRYLNVNLLNQHISSRHPSGFVAHDAESRRHEYRKKLIEINETLNMPAQNIRVCTKRKVAEEITNDKTVSHCLLTCPLCQESFATLESRNEHVRELHPEIQKYICQQCGLIFTNNSNYHKHMEKAHKINTLSKVHNNEIATYSCFHCPLVFTNQADLTHHVNLSHPEALNTEHDIDEKETDDIVENELLQPALESKPNDELCQPLIDLINTPSHENPIACTQCNIVSNNSFENAVHSLIHTDVIGLQSCPSCNKLFFGEFGKMYLKDHYNIVHLNKPAPECNLCQLSLDSSYALNKHHVNGVCQSDIIIDPYQPFMSPEKCAFSCSKCSLVFAGDSAQLRFEVHNDTCTFDEFDDDDFLDC